MVNEMKSGYEGSGKKPDTGRYKGFIGWLEGNLARRLLGDWQMVSKENLDLAARYYELFWEVCTAAHNNWKCEDMERKMKEWQNVTWNIMCKASEDCKPRGLVDIGFPPATNRGCCEALSLVWRYRYCGPNVYDIDTLSDAWIVLQDHGYIEIDAKKCAISLTKAGECLLKIAMSGYDKLLWSGRKLEDFLEDAEDDDYEITEGKLLSGLLKLRQETMTAAPSIAKEC